MPNLKQETPMITTSIPQVKAKQPEALSHSINFKNGPGSLYFDLQSEPLNTGVGMRELLHGVAKKLAESRHNKGKPVLKQLLIQLKHNAHHLDRFCHKASQSAENGGKLQEADQWLLDNQYLIHEQIMAVECNMPRYNSRRFLSLRNRPGGDFHRVHELASELVAHLDGMIDLTVLHEFISAYQNITPLTQIELCTLPNMMQFALLDYLCRAAKENSIHGDLSKSSTIGNNTSKTVFQDFRLNAIRHSIVSLHTIGKLNWKEFLESENIVERILRHDPAGIYQQMDFASRGHYLRAIEDFALKSLHSEEEIARKAIEHARQNDRTQMLLSPSSIDDREEDACDSLRSHVGYYLLGKGQKSFEKLIGYQPDWKKRIARTVSAKAFSYYLGAIILLWAFAITSASVLGSMWGASQNIGSIAYLSLLGSMAVVAAHFSISIVNWISTLIVPPRPMMRLDFSKGIPNKYRTLVAVPTMLTDEQSIRKLASQLEIRYSANKDDNLLFALLTDFPDANQESMPKDNLLLAVAHEEIQRLNALHCQNGPSCFYLLHRTRKWNPQEGVWMGEERKRGKLTDLNRFLLSGDGGRFSTIEGDLSRLASVRYVISLDTDTHLPRDAARKLVGCMAHPLNRPRIDPRTHRVIEGYAMLQPQVGVMLSDAHRSIFSRLLAGDAGIDPYIRQSSSLYHDLFAESSYIGKGIYDVEAFDAAMQGRFPNNRILSHDLIESCFATCGFVSDVELYEGVPFRLLGDMNRRHRWVRGDWQIASWLMPKVCTAHGVSANPLSSLSRWKIFDNLRRSLLPIFQLSLLLMSWFFSPHYALFWMAVALLAVSGPPLFIAGMGFTRKPAGKPLWLHLRDQSSLWFRDLFSEAIAWCILPYSAYSNLDAISRALFRTVYSRKNLLEWTSSGEAEARCNYNCRKHYRVMWPSPIVGLTVFAFLLAVNSSALPISAPMLLAWIAGPWIAWRISQSFLEDAVSLTDHEQRQLRRIARLTWHFFESHANRINHGLPPDNVQNYCSETIVSTTSPTNIGMGLLSSLAAHDLGYHTASSFLERTEAALKSMHSLERYRGHFYNWYDTRTLQPVGSRYISSIDSGNLWASLLVLRSGLEELRSRPLVHDRLLEGFQDTLEVISSLKPPAKEDAGGNQFEIILRRLQQACSQNACDNAIKAYDLLKNILALTADLDANTPSQSHDLKRWSTALVRQAANAKHELSRLAFWVRFPILSEYYVEQFPELKTLSDQLHELNAHCTLLQLPEAAKRVTSRIDCILALIDEDRNANEPASRKCIAALKILRHAANKAAAEAIYQLDWISSLMNDCRYFCKMDFHFLFHPQRQLLSVGYNVSKRRLDESFYDLLASESRLTSFVAISQDQLPVDHWFALGRMVDLSGGEPVLMSWAGSMFEYLLPLLFMPSYPGSFLEQSCRAAVQHQIRYARRQCIPWGISESCFNQTDENHIYQYRAFGVPNLSLQRKFDKRLVVAPYASALAVSLVPKQACANLAHLEHLGCLSPCGFFDAIDFTLRDLLPNGQPQPCRIVMAHHSGMTLLALTNALLNAPMHNRFLENSACESHKILLQERIPLSVRHHKSRNI
jgi:hypothetical protein